MRTRAKGRCLCVDGGAGRAAVIVIVAGAVLLPGAWECRGATYTPAQIRTAYGFDGIMFGSTPATGAGQTIAIIDWYNDPNIQAEVAAFNSRFGLQTFNSGGPTLAVVNQSGGATLPAVTTTSPETALDVEWAHAIAPKANIVLVEPNDPTFVNTNAAVNYAKSVQGVSVVSMSFGADDFAGESANDPTYTQAAGHAGVTFVASTGDFATPNYPAASPHVIGVGGTTLTVDASGKRTSEKVWADSTGAGLSIDEPEPGFQMGAQSSGMRSIPDVSYVGDPATGVYVVFGAGNNLLTNVGGTSIGAPQWAAIIAIANQGRMVNGLTPLTSDQALSMLYALYNTPLYAQAFYDVTDGSSNGFGATPGFDFASGLGTPNAGFLEEYLAGYISIPGPPAAVVLVAGALVGWGRRRSRG